MAALSIFGWVLIGTVVSCAYIGAFIWAVQEYVEYGDNGPFFYLGFFTLVAGILCVALGAM